MGKLLRTAHRNVQECKDHDTASEAHTANFSSMKYGLDDLKGTRAERVNLWGVVDEDTHVTGGSSHLSSQRPSQT